MRFALGPWRLLARRCRRQVDQKGEREGNTNRPGRNRTCNPRFWSALPATPALQRLLIFKDLAPGQQRRRRWTTLALALIPALAGATAASRSQCRSVGVKASTGGRDLASGCP